MKKSLLFAFVALLFMSCGNKTAGTQSDSDSTFEGDDKMVKEFIESLYEDELNMEVYDEGWLKEHCSEQCLYLLNKIYKKTMEGTGYYGGYLIGQEDGVGSGSIEFQSVEKTQYDGKDMFCAHLLVMSTGNDDSGKLYDLIYPYEKRDIYYDCSIKDGKVVINDVNWEQKAPSEEYVTLPADAERVGDGCGYRAYAVYHHTDDEEDAMVKTDLYLTDNEDGHVVKLFTTTTEEQEVNWKEAAEYPVTQIMAVTNVAFFHNDYDSKTYMVVQGCPDYRNIYSYLMPVSMNPKKALFLPAPSGFLTYNEEENTITCAGYDYHEEGGRYGILYKFDLKGKQISKEETDEEF